MRKVTPHLFALAVILALMTAGCANSPSTGGAEASAPDASASIAPAPDASASIAPSATAPESIASAAPSANAASRIPDAASSPAPPPATAAAPTSGGAGAALAPDNLTAENIAVSVGYATDAVLSKYDSYTDEYSASEYSVKIIVSASAAVKDFRFFTVGNKEEGSAVVFFAD